MASDSSIKAFNAYVGSAVNYYKTKKGWTNRQLAIQADFSESFIKQANTGSRHYNAFHLWRLARLLNISVYKLYPPLTTDDLAFKQYKEIRPEATYEDFVAFIHLLSE